MLNKNKTLSIERMSNGIKWTHLKGLFHPKKELSKVRRTVRENIQMNQTRDQG